MVSSPEPVVLRVEVLGILGDVKRHEGSLALGRRRGRGRALRNLQVGASPATNLGVDIPHTRTLLTVKVPFNKNGTSSATNSTDTHVRPLDHTFVTRLTNLHNRVRVAGIGEGVTTAGDDGVRFTNHLGAGRDVDSVGDLVNTVVEEDDGSVAGSRLERSVDSLGVVGRSITLGARVTDAHNGADRSAGVLRLGLGEVVGTRAGNKTARASNRSKSTLKSVRASGGVLVALAERGNSGGSTLKVGSAGSLDSGGDSVQNDVLQDQVTSAGGSGRLGPGSVDKGLDVRDGAVDDVKATNSLVGATLKADTSGAVLDVETNVSPAPVPDLADTSGGVVDGDVTVGELLVTNVHSVETTVDGDVGHPSTRAYQKLASVFLIHKVKMFIYRLR